MCEMKKWLRGRILLLAVVFLVSFVPVLAFAAESVQVKVPMLATGADCMVEVLDEEGNFLRYFTLKKDVQENLTIDCDGLLRFVYRVRVANADTAVLTFDKTEYTIVIDVYYGADDALVGFVTVKNEMTGQKGEILWENQYTPTPVSFDPPVEKTLANAEAAPDTTFYFTMNGSPDAPMPEGAVDGKIQVSKAGPGVVEFGEMRYTEEGSWLYTLEETALGQDGFVYDSTQYQLQVDVTNRDDALVLDYVIYTDPDDPAGSAREKAVFENRYEPTPPPTPTPTPTSTHVPTSTPTPTPAPTRNPYQYKFSFTKKWLGDAGDSINWTFYNPDGTERSKKFDKKIISETEWYYEGWFASEADYYLVEKVPEGYMVHYENVGAHAGETDRCYNGGTIINYKVPKTGDDTNPALWIALAASGIGGLALLLKKRRASAR